MQINRFFTRFIPSYPAWRIALLLAVALLPHHAAAQFAPPEEDEIRILYDKLMSKPDDRELNLRYATLNARIGDYESAIPPLERLLINEPNNSWLQLQLGGLYKALGSKAVALSYLQNVVNNASAPKETVEQARKMMQELMS